VRPGDTVGVVAPSTPFADAVPLAETPAFRRGVAGLERLGFRVRVAAHVGRRDADADVPARQRAGDLNALLADPDVAAIICAAGGSGANAVLPLLDWAAVARYPKALMGYSGATALLNGVTARTGLVTFHGPMVLDGFAEVPGLLPYTREQLWRVVGTAAPAGALRPPLEWTDEYPGDDRPRTLRPNPGWRWLRPGRGAGPLVGGNLSTLLSLAGTPYWPDVRGAVLFVEEVAMPPLPPLHAIDQALAQLRLLGVLDALAGLVVGKVNAAALEDVHRLDALVAAHTADATYPVLTQVDLGHTDPRLILPLGVRATLDAAGDRFSLDEPAVCARR
jgi:muramoyltetrapeptide carboxypeptidase